MYLTAQRVRSPRGVIGINSARFTHGSDEVRIDWDRPDMRSIALNHPGQRVTEHVEVAPGFNSVECFLDVAAKDGTDQASIVGALDEVQRRIGSSIHISVLTGAKVASQFSIILGAAVLAPGWFRNLRDSVLAILEQGTSPWEKLTPVTVIVEEDSKGFHYALASEDQQRVRMAASPNTIAATVNIPFEVAQSFREIHGELYPHASEWVTGLTREQLLALGGVRFVYRGKILWEWPARQPER